MVTRWVLWTTLELQRGGMPHEWCVRRSSSTQQLPQKVRFNSANGAHFVISWLKSCRLALMLTQIEINKANPACPSRTSSSCLLSITLATGATQMQTVFVCCVCLLDKLLSATFDSWLCTRRLCVCVGGRVNVKNNQNSVNIILVCWPLVTAAWPQYPKYAYNGILVRCDAGLRIIKP